MKKLYLFIVLVAIIQQSVFSQTVPLENNEIEEDFPSLDEGYLNIGTETNLGNYDFAKYSGTKCCVETPLVDITFGPSIQSFLTAQALIQEAQRRALNQWFDRQHTIIKSEIENQLGQTFSNYTDARNAYFKFHETKHIYSSHASVETKYLDAKTKNQNIENASLRNLKLLRLRETEIKAGNINTSAYASFSYNGVPLSNVKSLFDLQNLWKVEYNTFANNHPLYYNNNQIYNTVRLLGNLDTGQNSKYNHPIYTDLLKKHLEFYNKYDRWKQLQVIAGYLHVHKGLGVMQLPPNYIHPPFIATSSYIENYAIKNVPKPEPTDAHSLALKILDDQGASTYREAYDLALGILGTSKSEFERLLDGVDIKIESEINELLLNNPFALVEIDCNQIQKWQNLAQHSAPQSVKNKINSLPRGTFNDFEIQTLNGAKGKIVNLDYFSVNLTSFPINPATGQKFTAEGLLNHIRRNINNFVDGSTFNPYCEIESMCQTETNLWNSNNPLGSIVYIDIPGDDGVVVLTENTNSYWYFMTMNAPHAGNHPVSGTRQFGFEKNPNGSYNFYVRGTDRIDNRGMEVLAASQIFGGSDALWESFQNKTKDFINKNGGSSNVLAPVKNRPDWNKVTKVLKGERPVSDFGCK